MKKGYLICLKWILFISIVIVLLSRLSIFYENPKHADYNYKAFQNLSDEPDILVFGTSLMEMAFVPNELYKKYGYTSYNLAAPSQRLDSMYFVLNTVLEKRQPKYIFIVTDYINEVSKSETLDEEILSIRKLKGNEISKWKYLYNHFKYRSMEYLKFYLPILQFHYDLLDGKCGIEERQVLDKLYSKGYYYMEGSFPMDLPEQGTVQEEISEEAVAYTREVVDMCHQRGIEVVFVTIPIPEGFLYEESLEKNFSDCYHINFYELYEQIGLDGKTDFVNEHHLGLSGATKVTDYIGTYLQDNSNLVDHRKMNENNIWDITLQFDSGEQYKDIDTENWEKELKTFGYSGF